jgi:glycosyltransferase involved in cell wall biosynthesis
MNNYANLKFEWCGEILAEIGYGVQARNILRPLIEGGADVKLIPAEEYVPDNRKIKDPFWLEQIEKSKTKPDAPIRINFAIAPQFRMRPGAFHIGFCLWETNRLPNEWVPILNQQDHLFVPSPTHLDVYNISGITKPISVVRPSVSVVEPAGPVMLVNEVPEGTVKFLFSSNWIPRKNHQDLIAAFCCAFNNIQDVALVLKSWPVNEDINSKRNIEAGVRHFSDRVRGVSRPKIYLLNDYVDHSRMESIIRACDVYVSASKAEGYDSATITAMQMEKLILGMQFGIKSDYLNSMTSIPVDYSLEPVLDSAAPGYDAYQMWARPSIDSLMHSMFKAYNMIKNPALTTNDVLGLTAKQLGKNAREKVLKLYSPEINTPEIAKVITTIQNEISKTFTSKLAPLQVVPIHS